MAFEFKRVGIQNTITSITTAAPQVAVPAASGFITSITSIIAANQGGENKIALWDGQTKLTPSISVAASGTLFLDDFGGVQVELTKSSGLFIGLDIAGDFEVQVFYLQYDKRTPITKAQARANTRSNIPVSRALG